jgi:hypothetical protein
MSRELREIAADDIQAALERILAPRLIGVLASHGPGHCARVTDADTPLAVRLCERVRAAVGTDGQCFVLGDPPLVPAEIAVTSTKLVELRNPDENGALRSPLLVFVPPGKPTSAEDSFGVATFEDVPLEDVYDELAARLLDELPETLRRDIVSILEVVDEEKWPYATSYARARFLLTIQLNANDQEAVGAAFFELGLVPDLTLFEDHTRIRARTGMNVRQMRVLADSDRSERQRVLELGLTDAKFRSQLTAFVAQHGLGEPREWTRRIVIDRLNWPLSFHRWPLRDTAATEQVHVTIGELGLPLAGDQPEHANHRLLSNLAGQPVLVAGPKGANQLPVSFSAAPDPRHIPGLARFTAQIVSEVSGPTAAVASVKVTEKSSGSRKITFRKLRAAGLEPGWHYVRLLPQDDAGISLPVVPPEHGGQPTNESERFFVVAPSEDDDELDQLAPADKAEPSAGLTQALRAFQFKTLGEERDWRTVQCRRIEWKTQRTGRQVLRASFGRPGSAVIPMSPVLNDIQRQLLEDPARPPCRRQIWADGEEIPPGFRDEMNFPADTAEPVKAFLAARTAALRAVRDDDDLPIEGRDLLPLRPVAQAYAEAYRELLTWQLRQAERADETQRGRLLADLGEMLAVDTVEASVTGQDGVRRPVVLASPLHPLRLLWLVTWAELGQHWLESSADAARESREAAGRTLAELMPLGFPFVVPLGGGRLTVAGADLTPYWGACLPTDTPDPQSLLATLARALQLPERAGGHAVPPQVLADRVERHLRLHSYVSTLVISAVNPGRGEQLADMLVELQRRKHLQHVNYDIRIFAPDFDGANTQAGEALAALMRGEWTTGAVAEAFSTRQASGLIPKLAVAVLPLPEFRAATDKRPSHLTFLFDAFSGETFGAAVAAASVGTLPVHGLVQDIVVRYTEDDEGVLWRKQPRHGRTVAFPGARELCDLLTLLPSAISSAAAAVATGQVGTGTVPEVTLGLSPSDGALLHQAHRSSDWVVTVDRTLGMEYFDSPGSARRPDYVIDFEGSAFGELGHHLVVSSRSVDELRALLSPVIEEHALRVDPRHAGTFFEQLRLLSGRLAFKLASAAANQRTEVLGLVLARLYLEYQGALADQIVLPLDDHLELYRDARHAASSGVGEAVSLQRTDLALWSLDAGRREITCRLVEVKCYSAVRGESGLSQLRERIAAQLGRSESVLRAHFDPAAEMSDRPDRAVRNAELAGLLRFYLGRAVRHDVMRDDAAAEAEWMLGSLDKSGYRLRFTKSGLIFDLSAAGTESSSEEGVEYHQIGRDLIEELLDTLPTDPVLAAKGEGSSASTLDVSLPKLSAAAFRAPARSHKTPEEPASDVIDPTLDDLDDDLDDEPDAGPGAEPDADEPAPEPEPRGPAAPQPTSLEPRTSPEQDSRGGIAVPAPDVFLGTARFSPQYGVLGRDTSLGRDASFGRTVALDLNETHTISLFGVQGGGKSYTLGSIIEAATLPAAPVNELPSPLATIVFHYSQTLDYEPEFTSMIAPNSDSSQVRDLADRYGGTPKALSDVVVLVPADQLEERRREHPELTVLPLKFGSGELRAEHWRFLMGAVGNQSTYIRQLQRIMKAHRRDLRLDVIRQGVEESGLPDHLKQLAQQRLDMAADYIDDSVSIKDVIRPGRMIIVDLRDEFIEKDEALGLFVVLMQLFADAQRERFNKLVVFDEAHKYIDSPDLVDGLVSSVREMRHKGMSVLVASQDPPSVPIKLIELSDVVILHKFNSPAWLRHMQKAAVSLADLSPAKMAGLAPGEAYVWSSKSSETEFTRGAVRMRLRPRITQHGGATKTAVE